MSILDHSFIHEFFIQKIQSNTMTDESYTEIAGLSFLFFED